MSIRKRKKLGFRKKEKRKKKRARMKSAGKNPEEFFYSGIYVTEKKS
jgi:hypothetical protein